MKRSVLLSAVRLFTLSLSLLLLTVVANGQTAWSPSMIPTSFNGVDSMGPYEWMDGPTAIQNGKIANAVLGGNESGVNLYLCRAALSDGVHPGKFFKNSSGQSMCNIGWGGTEVVKTTGYQVLVNAHPEITQYMKELWVTPPNTSSFIGGSVGTAQLRVCRAAYINGWHPGKEWAGKCNIGYGGKEIAEGVYQVLLTGFDKTAWQNAQQETVIVTGLPSGTPQPTTNWLQPQPSTGVTVAVIPTVSNGLFMKSGNLCVGALEVNANATPKEAIAQMNNARGDRSLAATDGAANCLDHPKNWFQFEPRDSGWVRIKFFQTNYCLEAVPSAAGDHLPMFKACNDSKTQQWKIAGAGLVSRLTLDETLFQALAGENLASAFIGGSITYYCGQREFYALKDRAASSTSVNFDVRRMGGNFGGNCPPSTLSIETKGTWKYNEDKQGRILQ